MKIIELRAENVKRISAVAIKPAGDLVEITGRNGQGKTSVLDAIWWAIEGAKHIQSAPIRRGATEAKIEIDLGKLRVRRTFKAKDDGEFTTTLIVENDEGMRAQGPQDLLNGLLGALTFDPLAFTRMDAKKQFDALKGFVPGVDFDEITRLNKADYVERRDVNRRADALAGFIAGIPAVEAIERVDVAAMLEDMQKAGEQNAEIERRKAARERAVATIKSRTQTAAEARQEAIDLRRDADEADEAAERIEAEVAELQAKLDDAEALPAPVDVTDLRRQIADAQTKNAAAEEAERTAQKRKALEAEAATLETQADALTKRMRDRNAAKAKAIAAAKMPVPGLTFGDGEILLDGVPFEQGSDAEQLRVSVAIAAAMSPRLRVIRVRDGSLLDNDSMKHLAQIAEERDMQVWVETVQSGRAGAIVIEDGMVAGAAVAVAAE